MQSSCSKSAKNPILNPHSLPKVDEFAAWSWPRKCVGVGQITGSWTCHWESWSIATEYVIDSEVWRIRLECWIFWRRWDAQQDVSLGIPKWTGMTGWGSTAMEMLQHGKLGFFSPETNRMKVFPCRSRVKLIGWGSQLQYADKTNRFGALQPGPWPLSGWYGEFQCLVDGNCVYQPVAMEKDLWMGFIRSTDRSMEESARGAALLMANCLPNDVDTSPAKYVQHR